jgi:hypothetical protein
MVLKKYNENFYTVAVTMGCFFFFFLSIILYNDDNTEGFYAQALFLTFVRNTIDSNL